MAEQQDEKRTAPVIPEHGMPFPIRIPWVLHERAWSQYAAAANGDQSAERVAERGGFSVTELVACLRGYGYGAAGFGKVTAEDVALVAREAERCDALVAERDAALQREAEARAEAARLRETLEHYGRANSDWGDRARQALSIPGAETLRALRSLPVALQRLRADALAILRQQPVRGFDETLAEVDAALAAVPWLRRHDDE